jgi:hypothetical protein
MFSGVATVAQANQSNVIGGAVEQNKVISAISSKTTVVATLNLGTGAGISIGPNGGLLTGIRVVLAKAAVGATLVVTIKTGATYATSNTVATINIAAKTAAASFIGNINIAAGQSIYVNTSYSGNPTIRALGLTITFSNYPTTS